MSHDEPNNQTWQLRLSDADQQLIDRIKRKIADGKTITLMQENITFCFKVIFHILVPV